MTFDCYGTLIDWRHGIRTGAELVAPGQGERLLEAYTRHEPEVQTTKPVLRYRDVLAETLRRACAEEKVDLAPDDASILGETIPYWPPFPDVAAGLAELRAAGWRLALLTNCDRDLVAGALRRLPVPFEAVVTAEEAGAYKPEFAHFEVFRSAYEPEAWVHVAQSYFHDQVPAHRLGLPRVWINRLGHEPEDPSVIQRVQPGLHGLRAAVEAAYDEAAR